MTYDDGSGVVRETRCHPDYSGLAYRQAIDSMVLVVVNFEKTALVQSPIEVRDLPTPEQKGVPLLSGIRNSAFLRKTSWCGERTKL